MVLRLIAKQDLFGRKPQHNQFLKMFFFQDFFCKNETGSYRSSRKKEKLINKNVPSPKTHIGEKCLWIRSDWRDEIMCAAAEDSERPAGTMEADFNR